MRRSNCKQGIEVARKTGSEQKECRGEQKIEVGRKGSL